MPRLAVTDRREALVEAALRVMARDGLAAGTTRAVVAEAGMSLASFHYAFASRDELLAELVRRVVGRELAAATAGPGPRRRAGRLPARGRRRRTSPTSRPTPAPSS